MSLQTQSDAVAKPSRANTINQKKKESATSPTSTSDPSAMAAFSRTDQMLSATWKNIMPETHHTHAHAAARTSAADIPQHTDDQVPAHGKTGASTMSQTPISAISNQQATISNQQATISNQQATISNHQATINN
jgi:hypothetical protein